MRFADPWWLLLLVPVAGLAVLLWLRSQRPEGLKYSSLGGLDLAQPKPAIGPDEILGSLIVLGLCLAVFALARPRAGMTTEQITGSGVDIILCLDTSGSMRSVDFKPQNRLGAAKEVARRFIQGRPHDRIGLVVFGGAAVTICPLTLDRQALLTLLDQVSIDITGVDGTAMGMALATSADRLRTSQARSKVIVLLTDGRNNTGAIEPLTAARAAGALGVKIYAVGAGSPEGGLMPVVDPIYGTRYVRLPEEELDEAGLREVAAVSRGQYFRAKDSAGLQDIFRRIDQLEKSDYRVTEFTHYRDLYFGWLVASLLCLMAAAGLGETVLRRIP
jgi:Ca-activated chloride channel family protein